MAKAIKEMALILNKLNKLILKGQIFQLEKGIFMIKKVASKTKAKNTTTKKSTLAKKKTAIKSPAKKKKVSPIPKGYSSITPYLIVKNAAKAIEFYKKVFLAKEVMRMDKPGGKIGHAELKIGDTKIMLADEAQEMGAKASKSPEALGNCSISIHLYTKNVDATIKLAVAAGAKLLRPVEDMFYGDRIGMVQDPYGHMWSVATHIEDVSKATLKKRAAELYSKKA